MRYSLQRERIYEAVAASADHPTAHMIYESLRAELPKLSLGTVYRDLNQLYAAGRILKIAMPDGQCRFDKTVGAHAHIVCERCGLVADVSLPHFERIQSAVLLETSYQLRSLDAVLRGLCQACAAEQEDVIGT
jgi:Fur family peroxide stress response transcriptional regulator